MFNTIFLTGFVSIALIGLFIYLYLKEKKTPGYKTPTLLRLLVLLLLVFIVIGKIFRFTFSQSPKIPVLVLVDASKSIIAGNNISQITEIINKIKQEPLKKKYFTFTDTIGPLENYLNPTGHRTDIGQALSFTQKQRPGAIVLISDGLHNARTDPSAIAQTIKAPIYTIGVGSEQKQDVSIQSIRKPIRAFFGDTIEITSRIQNLGFDNQSIKVSLQQKGKTIAVKDITLSGKDALQEASFKIVPETTGKINYTIKIDSLFDEADYSNNRKQFTIEILKDRWQIVYITNAPSFNTRFIISILENTNQKESNTQNNFTVIPIVSFSGQDISILKDISLDQAFQNADVVILDDINENNLNPGIITKLRSLIDQGKGFLILTGENFKSRNFFPEILPFVFTANNLRKKEIFVDLTDIGAQSPIFFNDNNEFLLDNTPPLWGINTPSSIKPEAVIWAQTKEEKLPLIGYEQYKNNKIVLIDGYPFWRLGFSSIETEKQKERFEQFARNLIRFLAVKDIDNFKLTADKPDYLSGEDIIFDLLAITPDGRNWSGLDININVPKMKNIFPLYESSSGVYEGDMEALSPGEYEAEAVINKEGKLVGKARTAFSVTQQSIEDITGLNPALLVKFADITNGRYYTANEFIHEPFIPNLIKYKHTISFTFHNNLYNYIIITVLFGIMLFLRKKRGFL